MSPPVNPDLAYPDGVTNLMILAARGDVLTIAELAVNEARVNRADERGYTALDYGVGGAHLYLTAWVEEILMPFGRQGEGVTVNKEEGKVKCKDAQEMPCANYVLDQHKPHQHKPFSVDQDRQLAYENRCENIYRKAQWRGISTNHSREEICRQINLLVPSAEWQQQSYDFYQALPKKEQALIADYLVAGFQKMNPKLQQNPNSEAPINRILERMTPLPHDILVFRGFTHEKYPNRGLYVHHGYLSTSILEFFGTKGNSPKVLRMIVPKGTRCLYIGITEGEILLPHNSRIQILTSRTVTEDYFTIPLPRIVYDGVLLL